MSLGAGEMARLSAPGKTFLVGEYVALAGGPSLVLATAPRFELVVSKIDDSKNHQASFAPQSPAGRFLGRHAESVRGHRFEFLDPHTGRGGLGASSAQFALVFSWLKGEADFGALLEEYRVCAWSGEGAPPSGADLVAQITGGITWFDGRSLEARKFDWAFADLSFTLIRTGAKLATHEHLKRTQAIPNENLREQVFAARAAIEAKDGEALRLSIQRTSSILREAGLCAARTEGLLNELIAERDWCMAAKGCGAMGADVIFVLHAVEDSSKVRTWAAARGLDICGSERDLNGGLRR